MEAVPDVLNYSVDGDVLAVDRSREGFVIDVFDAEGRLLSSIRREAGKIPVTAARRGEAMEHIKTHPFVKRVGLEQFLSMSRLKRPDVMPALRSLIAADGKIYARTFKSGADREDWLILDRKGGLLKTMTLPRVDPAPLIAHLYGVEFFTVKDGRFFYLKDNEETGEWELRVEEIKAAP